MDDTASSLGSLVDDGDIEDNVGHRGHRDNNGALMF